MPHFSRRRMNRQELHMFIRTGQVMVLWSRITPPNTAATPSDLFAADSEPLEGTDDLQKHYIIGQFQEQAVEQFSEIGRLRQVTGTITVPMMYKSLLAQAAYIDPYNDGVSRFKKCGTMVDEERLFVTQKIEAVTLKSVGDEQ